MGVSVACELFTPWTGGVVVAPSYCCPRWVSGEICQGCSVTQASAVLAVTGGTDYDFLTSQGRNLKRIGFCNIFFLAAVKIFATNTSNKVTTIKKKAINFSFSIR